MRRWRSLLFVPGDRPDRLAKVHDRNADAIIIDLEDSVSALAKDEARSALASNCAMLRRSGCDIVVRINSPWRIAMADIDAISAADCDAIMVPKVETAARLATIAEMIAEFEHPPGGRDRPGLIALIESPSGLQNLEQISKVGSLIGLALGSEDFSVALGVAPTPESLALPCRQIALAAAASSLMALGMPLSIAEFRDAEALRSAVASAKAVGLTGALCIHPAQVSILNEGFGLSASELEQARAVLAAWQQAQTRGEAVASLAGRMIDAPVAERARRILMAAR